MDTKKAYLEIDKIVKLSQRVDSLLYLFEQNPEISNPLEITQTKNVKAGIDRVLDDSIQNFCPRCVSNLEQVAKLIKDSTRVFEQRVEAAKCKSIKL